MEIMIRKQEEADRSIFDEFYKDEEVLKELFLPQNAESWIHPDRKSLEKRYEFTIIGDDEVVGQIILQERSICRSTYWVWFYIGRPYRNRGYCTKALKQVITFAFDELELHRVVSDSSPANPAAERVLEKAGLKKELIRKEQRYEGGAYVDHTYWGLISPTSKANKIGTDKIIANMAVTIRKTEESDRAILDGFFKESYPQKFEDAEARLHPCRKSLEKEYWFTIQVDGKVVGEIGIESPSMCRSTYNVGYAVGRPYWNRGYCTEALKQLVRFAFDELKLHRLEGSPDSDNPASSRVFEKAGFTKEGILKEQVYKRGSYIDRIHWGLINSSPESL